MHPLLRLTESWASLYNDAPLLQTMVLFAHLAGLLGGGGFALAADRATLRIASATPADRLRHLSELRAVHRPVLVGLVLTFFSGLLMLGADLEIYLDSRVFWVKMVLIGLLVANGYALRHAGALLHRGREDGWGRLRTASAASSAPWLAVVLAGTWLTSME